MSSQDVTHFLSHPQMWLFSKDVEGSLLLQELSLKTVTSCRGRQILPCQSGAHVSCCRVLDEPAAGAQAGPHACKHTDTNKSHTNTCGRWPVLIPLMHTCGQTNYDGRTHDMQGLRISMHSRTTGIISTPSSFQSTNKASRNQALRY